MGKKTTAPAPSGCTGLEDGMALYAGVDGPRRSADRVRRRSSKIRLFCFAA